jgi:hypothetical protein
MGRSKRKRAKRETAPRRPRPRSARKRAGAPTPRPQPPTRAVSWWWVAPLVVLAVLVVVFQKALLTGMVYAPPDVIGGAKIVGHFVQEEARAGRPMPLWCPYIFGGMPMIGSLMWAPFYPLDIVLRKLFHWLPSLKIPHSPNYLHHLLAALWTYLLLRHLKTRKTAALVGAIAFAFSPYLVVLTPAGHGGKLWTASYLPLLLLALVRLYERASLTRFAVASLAMGLAFLANHPQIAYYGVLLLFLYWLLQGIADMRKRPKTVLTRAALLLAVVIAGAAMAAVVYLPAQEYARFSIRGEGKGSYDWATAWSFHPTELITFFIPSFFGYGGATYWGHMPFTEAPNYIGITVLMLATAALRRPLGRFKIFLVLSFGIALVISFGRFLPILYGPMYHLLPYFDRFRVPVLIQVVCMLSAAVLAGLGVGEATERKDGRRPLIPWLVVAGVVALALSVFPEAFKSLASTKAPALADQRHRLAVGDAWKALVLAVAIYGALGLRRKQLAKVLAVTLVIVDLAWVDLRIARPHYESFDEHAYFAETPMVRFLKSQSGHFRFLPTARELSGNNPMYYGLQSLSGYSPARLRVSSELLNPDVISSPAVLNMLNCQYIASARPLRYPRWTEVFREGQTILYRNDAALPRAWLVGDVEVVPGRGEMFDRLRDPSFDPSTTALLYEAPGEEVAMTIDGGVEVADYAPNRMEFRTWSGAPAFVVVSEMYYPAGWRAYVDGEEVPIYQTNHGLRGMTLPAGEHRVVMQFRPWSYFTGRSLSIGAGAILVLCLLAGVVIQRMRSRR